MKSSTWAKYERQHYIGINPNLREAEQQKQLAEKEAAFVDLILRAYRAEKTEGFNTFHGKKAGRLVAVGPVNLPVTRLFVEEVILECRQKHITRVDIPWALSSRWACSPNVLDEARAKGIDIAPSISPPRCSTNGRLKRTRWSFTMWRLSRSSRTSRRTAWRWS